MATVDEVISQLDLTQEAETCVSVDWDTREIDIPRSTILGVENDKDIKVLKFKAPRYYGQNDMSEFAPSINYINCDGDKDTYLSSLENTDDNEITFTWLMGPNTFSSKGDVHFIVCMKKGDDEVDNQLNTTLASFRVLEGMSVDTEIVKQNSDVIYNFYSRLIKIERLSEQLPEEISNYVNEHKDELKGPKGETGEAGPTGPKGETGESYDDTEIKESVSELKQTINSVVNSKFIVFVEGANRIDNSTWVKGFLSSGINISGTSTNYYTTGYIDIHDSIGRNVLLCRSTTTITIKRNCRYAFYDENKNVLDYQVSGSFIEIPQNAYYIRISDDGGADGTHINDMLIVCDTDVLPTEYIEYVEPLNENINAFDGSKVEDKSITVDKLADGVIPSVAKVFLCGSTREYKKLKDVIEEAVKYENSIVYVDAETFDLVEEYGTDYLDTYSSSYSFGIMLKNNIHVIFEQGARIVFDYQGTNENIHKLFSPFVSSSTSKGGFTLENCYIESKNCRYSVHDECGGNTIPYTNIYKNCTFIHDSSQCSWGAHQAIGGGLGKNATIILQDCYGYAEGSETFTWHNSSAENAESTVIVKGCYADVVRVSSYGSSTKKTRAFVSNCSLKSKPRVDELFTAPTVVNVDMYAWNNEIRS